jgi:tRNA A-37 threonylcarbamoyl transferase component Bud32
MQARMHGSDVIHGDLTTSNALWVERSNELVSLSKSSFCSPFGTGPH